MTFDKGAPRIAVIGAGSVGRRHLRNLVACGCAVGAADPRADRIAEAADEVELVASWTRLDELWASVAGFDAVVIASPTAFHVEQSIRALEAGLPVLLEKPAAKDAAEARALRDAVRRTGAPLLLGYTYRWWPALRALREAVRSGEIGRPLHVQCTLSAHLADWHPWERYQDFFMASAELGGGALLDESHFVDLLLWVFGRPERVFASVERLSDLEIGTDDDVDALFAFADRLRAQLHLDLFGRPHAREVIVRGDAGTVQWTFDPNELRVTAGDAGTRTECFSEDRNDMFLAVTREFLQIVAGDSTPSCTIDDGVAAMVVLDAMRVSSESRTEVVLPTAEDGW